MKKICIEEHFMTQEYVDYIRATFSKGEKLPGVTPEDEEEIGSLLAMFNRFERGEDTLLDTFLDVGEGRLEAMDGAGIDMQVLSLVQGVQIFGNSDAISMAKKINDRLSEIVKARPDRFAGLATLPYQNPEASADELNRAVRNLGLKGALIFSHAKGEYIDDRKYWAIFEAAAKLDVPLYFHPRTPLPDMIKPFTTYPQLVGAMWGFAATAGLAAMRLICSGVFDEYPDLKIIIGHMGEALPYWLWRIDNKWEGTPLSKKLKKTPSQYINNNFYITTSGMFWTPALICAYLGLGADRILFGADYPLESINHASDFIDSIPISAGDKEKIAHLNLERLLKL